MNKDIEPKKKYSSENLHTGRWFTIGIEFTIVVVAGAAVGYLLDMVFNSLPGFMIMGFFAGFARMIYVVMLRSGYFDRENKK